MWNPFPGFDSDRPHSTERWQLMSEKIDGFGLAATPAENVCMGSLGPETASANVARAVRM
jgi:hypothetical protein